MEYRGPTLIAFSLALVAVPVLVHLAEGRKPVAIAMFGAKQEQCDRAGVDTIAGRLGCGSGSSTRSRIYAAGGALFVRH